MAFQNVTSYLEKTQQAYYVLELDAAGIKHTIEDDGEVLGHMGIFVARRTDTTWKISCCNEGLMSRKDSVLLQRNYGDNITSVRINVGKSEKDTYIYEFHVSSQKVLQEITRFLTSTNNDRLSSKK